MLRGIAADNPVYSIISRAYFDQLPQDEILRLMDSLHQKAIQKDYFVQIFEGLKAVANDVPSRFINICGRITAEILIKCNENNLAFSFIAHVGHLLGQRSDPESLELAVKCADDTKEAELPDDLLMALAESEGLARAALGKMGIQPKKNLEMAMAAFQRGGRVASADQVARFILGEAQVSAQLVELGISVQENIFKTKRLLTLASKHLRSDRDRGGMLMIEAQVMLHCPENRAFNLERIISLCADASKLFSAEDPNLGSAALLKSHAHFELARLGKDADLNSQYGVQAAQLSKSIFPSGSPERGRAIIAEALILQEQASKGCGMMSNALKSIGLFEEALECFPPNGSDAGIARVNLSNVLRLVAELGINAASNLNSAIGEAQRARKWLSPGTAAFGTSLMNEATARRRLAENGEGIESNLTESCRLLDEAISCFSEPSNDFGGVLLNKANSLLYLAKNHYQPNENLRNATKLIQRAKTNFASDSEDAALALSVEAMIFHEIAALHQTAKAFTDAINAYVLAANLTVGAWKKAKSLLNAGAAFLSLSDVAPTAEEKLLKAAEETLTECIELLRQCRSDLISEGHRIAFQEKVAHAHFNIVRVLFLQVERAGKDKPETKGLLFRLWDRILELKSRTLAEVSFRGTAPDANLRLLYSKWAQSALELETVEALRLNKFPKGSFEHHRFAKAESLYGKLSNQLTIAIEQTHDYEDCPKADDVRAQVPCIFKSSRVLLMEFTYTSESKIAVLMVPLWDEHSIEVVTFETKPDSLKRVHRLAIESERRPIQQKRIFGSDNESADGLMGEFQKSFKPVFTYIKKSGASEFIISPHFWLNVIPIHAICDGMQPLIASGPVTYLPSSALVTKFSQCPSEKIDSITLFGNPTLDLPCAHDEVREISNVLSSHLDSVRSFFGPDITPELIQGQSQQSTIIHYAGHSKMELPAYGRSGLALMRRRFSILDIAMMNLTNVKLVYLSSCESCGSVIQLSDELLAIARSFLRVGAQAVIATLWSVEDDVAQAFAVRFYTHLVEAKCTFATAFQRAMIEIRNEFKRTEAWAPFVILGNSQQTLHTQ